MFILKISTLSFRSGLIFEDWTVNISCLIYSAERIKCRHCFLTGHHDISVIQRTAQSFCFCWQGLLSMISGEFQRINIIAFNPTTNSINFYQFFYFNSWREGSSVIQDANGRQGTGTHCVLGNEAQGLGITSHMPCPLCFSPIRQLKTVVLSCFKTWRILHPIFSSFIFLHDLLSNLYPSTAILKMRCAVMQAV